MNRIVRDAIDLAALIESVAHPAGGALVLFTGDVRDHHEGSAVSGITYTAYEPMAESVLAELEDEASRRDGILVCRIVHRTGRLAVGETSVAIAVRSKHRAEGFAAARHAIDELKQRAPIWKEEHLVDGSSRFARGVPLRAGGQDH